MQGLNINVDSYCHLPTVKKRPVSHQNTSGAPPAESGERGRAEEALRKSEQRLQDILDNTTAVVFVKDLELRYILVNREYERRHQVRRDQIRGKTDFDIFPRDVAEKLRANDRQVIEACAPVQFEETVPMAEGERQYVVVKFLLRDGVAKPYREEFDSLFLPRLELLFQLNRSNVFTKWNLSGYSPSPCSDG